MNCKVLVVFLVACLATGYALKCYECQSQIRGHIKNDPCAIIYKDTTKIKEKECEGRSYEHSYPDDFRPQSLPDTIQFQSDRDENPFYCMKQITTIKDYTVVYRSCVQSDMSNMEKGCKALGSGKEHQFTCFLCNGDLCNSANAIMPSTIVSIAMLLIGKLLYTI